MLPLDQALSGEGSPSLLVVQRRAPGPANRRLPTRRRSTMMMPDGFNVEFENAT